MADAKALLSLDELKNMDENSEQIVSPAPTPPLSMHQKTDAYDHEPQQLDLDEEDSEGDHELQQLDLVEEDSEGDHEMQKLDLDEEDPEGDHVA